MATKETLEQKSTREGGENEVRGSLDAMKALGRKPVRTAKREDKRKSKR